MVDAHKNISGILNVVSEFRNNGKEHELILIGENSKSYKKITKRKGLENVVMIDQIDQSLLNDYFAEEKKKEEEAAKAEELAKPDPIKQAMSDDVVNEEIQRSLNKIH